LHEFADALNAHAQGESDFTVSETLGAQENTLALLRRELRKSILELAPPLIEDDLLFGSGARICAAANDRIGLLVFVVRPASLGAMDVHREIVGNPK
jgi:hypothetical protein